MAPKGSQLLSNSSQKGKQQSISSFFTSKPTQTIQPVQPTLPTPAAPVPDNQAHDSDDEDTIPIKPSGSARKRIIDEDSDIGSSRGSTSSKRIRFAENGVRLSLEQASETTLNVTRAPRLSERTSGFLLPSSPLPRSENQPSVAEDAASQKQKERIHEKFVKKLGRPDSFVELRRRNKIISEEEATGENGDGEDEENKEPAPKTGKGKKMPAIKKGGSKLTPMEKQYLEIKRKHLDTVIVMEVGYKFKFFGEDARTASKELGIVCIPGKFRYDEHVSEAHLDRFASASFPTHRLQVHVKRLVKANHKVGVVRQLETAALKAVGDNRNTPFVRKLTNLYTKGTYVDDVEGLETQGSDVQQTGYLLCITETNAKGWGMDEKVQVGLLAVQPATGDIIYDDFEDGFMRSEIETRLLHISPAEFLIVGDLSKATDKLIQHLSASKTNVFGDKSRVERVEKPKAMAAQAYIHISNFYAGKMSSSQDDGSGIQSTILDKVHQLTEHVTICLSAMITYLTDYGLEHVFDLTKYFQPFSARSYMLLNGNTLSSLEIYQNQTDYSIKGSLFWIMDRTKTRFGQRLLRKWVGRPLIDRLQLEERIAAVEELKDGENTIPVDKLKFVLGKIKTDLEKVLIRIYYKKCTRPELLAALQTLHGITGEYLTVKSPDHSGFSSPLLSQAVANVPKIYEHLNTFLDKINARAAKDDDKYAFFRDEFEAEEIIDLKLSIVSVEDDLNTYKKEAATKLGKSKVEYVTVAGIEYLIEVKRKSPEEKNIPASWQQISATKAMLRFHTPEVKRLLQERDQYKESLAVACDKAFRGFLDEIAANYQQLRDCVHSLATLDALLSLAILAQQHDYVKPTFSDSIALDIVGGRHPMVEQILLDSYVPNDMHLSHDSTRALLITGPNMGGKSSYVRSTALIAIMGQIGSYVPATEARLGMLDAVFTRMGAFDNMLKGESTFMVELNETADILKSATPRSLIILDELGRGTSTFDGVAIAEAVLDYVIRDLQSLTLFITHYQHLAKLQGRFPNKELKNVHMRFEEQDGGKEVVFLYEAAEGISHRSYGLNVARLARVPEKVIEIAETKSSELEQSMTACKMGNLSRMMKALFTQDPEQDLAKLVDAIEHL